MTERLLLVDDEEGIRKVLRISLMDRGYEVGTAAGGEEALALFREQQPQIVLTDIKMPGMDGIEVLRRIKAESPDTEVIMITGHGDIDLAIQSLKHDATDFITKPINDEALGIALKRAHEKIYYKEKLREYTENLERLVAEKTRELLAAERLAAVGQTVSGLAHAIKNVAGGLTGGGFVLEKGIELHNETYLAQGWEMVRGNVERLKKMALDLLNYAKERTPAYVLCDPNQPMRDVHRLLWPQAEKREIRLRLELDESLPPVRLDPETVHRCLLDLATNAVDACGEVRGRLAQVILGTRPAEGWAVEYRVEDTGCGMDAETREKIFQTFFSTKGSRGTGLGLMITKKTVDEHGGTIRFDSDKGRGTVFIIRLPAGEESAEGSTARTQFGGNGP